MEWALESAPTISGRDFSLQGQHLQQVVFYYKVRTPMQTWMIEVMISQLDFRFHVKPRIMLCDCPPMAVLRLWVLLTECGMGTFIPAITLLFCACAVGILPHNRATKTKPDQMFNINRSFWQLNVFVILWIYKNNWWKKPNNRSGAIPYSRHWQLLALM